MRRGFPVRCAGGQIGQMQLAGQGSRAIHIQLFKGIRAGGAGRLLGFRLRRRPGGFRRGRQEILGVLRCRLRRAVQRGRKPGCLRLHRSVGGHNRFPHRTGHFRRPVFRFGRGLAALFVLTGREFNGIALFAVDRSGYAFPRRAAAAQRLAQPRQRDAGRSNRGRLHAGAGRAVFGVVHCFACLFFLRGFQRDLRHRAGVRFFQVETCVGIVPGFVLHRGRRSGAAAEQPAKQAGLFARRAGGVDPIQGIRQDRGGAGFSQRIGKGICLHRVGLGRRRGLGFRGRFGGAAAAERDVDRHKLPGIFRLTQAEDAASFLRRVAQFPVFIRQNGRRFAKELLKLFLAFIELLGAGSAGPRRHLEQEVFDDGGTGGIPCQRTCGSRRRRLFGRARSRLCGLCGGRGLLHRPGRLRRRLRCGGAGAFGRADRLGRPGGRARGRLGTGRRSRGLFMVQFLHAGQVAQNIIQHGRRKTVGRFHLAAVDLNSRQVLFADGAQRGVAGTRGGSVDPDASQNLVHLAVVHTVAHNLAGLLMAELFQDAVHRIIGAFAWHKNRISPRLSVSQNSSPCPFPAPVWPRAAGRLRYCRGTAKYGNTGYRPPR